MSRPSDRPDRRSRTALLAAWLLFALSAACSPKLVVRHQDLASGQLTITLDRERSRSLDYGDSTSWRVSKGTHRLRIQDRSGSTATWGQSEEGLRLVIERSATFTLMPPNVAAEPAVRQNVSAPLREPSQTPVVDGVGATSGDLGEASERR